METCKHELPLERCAICTAPAKVASAAKSKKQTTDVGIVAAGVGYPEYLSYSAYVGHPNRPFRDGMRWMAFYADGEIKPEIPEILHLEEAVSLPPSTRAKTNGLGGAFRSKGQRVCRPVRSFQDQAWVRIRRRIFPSKGQSRSPDTGPLS